MTREEAIDIIKCLAWHTRPDEEEIEQAIKALEQEPCDEQSVYERAYKEGYDKGWSDGNFCGKHEQEPITRNDLGVDAVSRKDVHDMLENLPVTVENKWFNWLQKACMRLAELPSITPQEPKEKCKWIKYDYRTIMPKGHTIDSPFWRIPENRAEIVYCPYCGKEIEVEE